MSVFRLCGSRYISSGSTRSQTSGGTSGFESSYPSSTQPIGPMMASSKASENAYLASVMRAMDFKPWVIAAADSTSSCPTGLAFQS